MKRSFKILLLLTLSQKVYSFKKTSQEIDVLNKLCQETCSTPKKVSDSKVQNGICPGGVCNICLAKGPNGSSPDYCKQNGVFISAPIRLFPYSSDWLFTLPTFGAFKDQSKMPHSPYFVGHKASQVHVHYKLSNYSFECPGDSFLVGFVRKPFRNSINSFII